MGDAHRWALITELVQQRLGQTLPAKYVSLEPPWEILLSLVSHVCTRGNTEDVIEFFKCALLGLWQPEEADGLLVLVFKWGQPRLTS